jgi:hypothetical protein
MISLIKGWVAPIAFLIVLSALGFQTYRVEGLQGDLELSRQNASAFLQTANQNAAVLIAVKQDFNSSLNACYGDIKNLADRFDNYREAIAKSASAAPLPAPQTITCEIGGANALIDRLNAFN